ncbi:DNA repair protein RecO C-terminal domain-containing protein [Treponema sp. HNW]|uniref:DNA repair protein RecO n=1 Tax=Treponema sp. HNW TaxID=3116654 RepID=UPI003D0AD146
MNRNSAVEALILSVKASGENNRFAVALSPEKGIFSVTVYGGKKGRFKSLVSPYHSGKMWLYSDTVKKSIKLTDFYPDRCRTGIRENVYKTCAAALCAELILKTQGAADWTAVWILANGFLDGLDICSEEEAQAGLLRFLWRYIHLTGLYNTGTRCTHCENEVPVCFSAAENGFICADCIQSGRDREAGIFPLGAQSIGFLHAVLAQSHKEARSLRPNTESLRELRDFLYYLAQACADTKLKTLEAGKGIL